MKSNKEIVRLFYEEGWNNKNLDIVDQTHTPDWVHHDPSNPGDLEGGPEGNKRRMAELIYAFPDIHFQIEEMVAEGDLVMLRFTASGTHEGLFANIPPRNRKVSISGFICHRFKNGKIVEDWAVRDTFGLMVQLGVIPVPG